MASNKLFPEGDPRAALIYANAMAPLAKIPGDVFQGIMQSREQTRLEESRRDLERARREERRKTKRREFLEATDALSEGSAISGSPAVAAQARTKASSKASPPAGRLEVTVDPTTGMEVVSGMDFGPGSDFSPEDITLAMVRPTREETIQRVEERRRAGKSLEDLLRFRERYRGSAPTIQERAAEIIRDYNLTPQRATEIAGREALGQETPAFDRLVSKRADETGFVSPAAKERVKPEGERRPDEDIAVAAGQGAYLGDLTPEEQRNPFWRDMNAPVNPYGDPTITPRGSSLMEASEVMSGILDGDYLGDQTPERVMQARAYERYMAAQGDEQGARNLRRIRQVAWAQRAREKKKFMAAMMPSLQKVGVPNPEEVADLYFEEPEQGKTVYAEAAQAYRQTLANFPRVDEEREKRERADALGRNETETIINDATTGLLESHKNTLRLTDAEMERLKGVAKETEDFQEDILSRQKPEKMRFIEGRNRTLEQKVQFLLDDRTGAVSEEDKAALMKSKSQLEEIEQMKVNVAFDQELLSMETAALKNGERQVAFRVTVGGETRTMDALSDEGSLSFNDPVTDQNAARMYGGRDFVTSTATAEARGGATANEAYLDPGSVIQPPARPLPTPKVTRPTKGDREQLVKLLIKSGYEEADAVTSVASMSANPTMFWNQMNRFSRQENPQRFTDPGFIDEAGGQVETRDEDVYPDGWKAKAYDAGYRLVDPKSDGPWANEKVLGKGNTVTRAQLENKFGQD